MRKISDTELEKICINKIKKDLNSYGLFKATFNEEIKNKSIEGTLYIYDDNNDDHISKIKGKIKTCTKFFNVKSFEESSINFAIGLKELKKYYMLGGAVLFVSQIDSNENCRIFFKVLSTKVIDDIIADTKLKGNSFFAKIHMDRILGEKRENNSLAF